MSNNSIFEDYQGHQLFFEQGLPREVIDSCLSKFGDAIDSKYNDGNFNTFGRGEIKRIELSEGSFILRAFKRGGLLSNINKSLFLRPISLKCSSMRPFIEHSILLELQAVGVRVPSPVLSFTRIKFGLFYQGAIVTRELRNSKNLLALMMDDQLSTDGHYGLIECAYNAGCEVAKIVDAGIFHADLHPGNILIVSNLVYVIDFDKAKKFSKNIESAKNAKNVLIERWSRSILKWIPNKSRGQEYIKSFQAGIQNSN